MTSHYERGRRFEYATRDHLRDAGYDVFRAAGSKTKADLIAVKPGQVLIVQCKATALPSPHERTEILRIANCLPGIGIAVIARKGPRGIPVALERLLTADRSPKAREPFHVDLMDETSDQGPHGSAPERSAAAGCAREVA